MREMVHEKEIPLADEDGRRFDLVRVHAQERPGGTWEGWIEFRSAEGEAVRCEGPRPRRASAAADQGAYWVSPQKGHTDERACSGFRQCQQNPFFGTSRALRRLRMSSIAVAVWSISPAVARSSSNSDAR